jgi:Pre-mRNA splicing factor/N-terminal domain of CBF1 interacting co-repressor CIR
MGGGDLNMKKSWHPLLLKNQERVWQEENKAREERKRIEQKRKEIAEERQLQELQRLQESQGGTKPRVERLDWMYTAPGTGAQSVNEQLEQYLLGKRGVDELIKGDENEKLKRGAETGIISVQNANSAVDTRNKIFNDPLLAIKKQEQKKFEELMSNPIMLKKLKKDMEKKGEGEKKEDEERRHHKSHHRRHRHRDDDISERRHRDRDEDGHRSEKQHRDRDDDEHRREKRHRERDDDYQSSKSRRYDDDRPRRSDPYNGRRRDRSPRRRSPDIRQDETPVRDPSSDDARAAALQAMQANAEELESSRTKRLAELEAKEEADLEQENLKRSQNKGLGGRAGFMRDMQNRIMEEGRVAVVR